MKICAISKLINVTKFILAVWFLQHSNMQHEQMQTKSSLFEASKNLIVRPFFTNCSCLLCKKPNFIELEETEIQKIHRKLNFGFTSDQIIREGRITKNDINLLKTWLSTQKFPELTDQQIVLFLLSCRNNQKTAQKTIKAYFSIKNGSHMFSNRKLNRKDLQKSFTVGNYCVYPKRTDDGNVIVMISFSDPNFSHWSLAASLIIIFMTLEAAVHDHPPSGLILLVDLNQMNIMHLTKLKVGILHTFFQYLQEGLPLELKKIHVLNTVPFIDKIMNIIKPFLKKEVLTMMSFHSKKVDMEWFYNNCIPRKNLPVDLGGDLPSIAELHKANIKNLSKMQDYFDAEEAQRRSVLKKKARKA